MDSNAQSPEATPTTAPLLSHQAETSSQGPYFVLYVCHLPGQDQALAVGMLVDIFWNGGKEYVNS